MIFGHYVFHSKTSEGSRAICVLVDPQQIKHLISSCLKFSCTNNITKYEALILGFQRDINLNIVVLKVVGDYKIVV